MAKKHHIFISNRNLALLEADLIKRFVSIENVISLIKTSKHNMRINIIGMFYSELIHRKLADAMEMHYNDYINKYILGNVKPEEYNDSIISK